MLRPRRGEGVVTVARGVQWSLRSAAGTVFFAMKGSCFKASLFYEESQLSLRIYSERAQNGRIILRAIGATDGRIGGEMMA